MPENLCSFSIWRSFLCPAQLPGNKTGSRVSSSQEPPALLSSRKFGQQNKTQIELHESLSQLICLTAMPFKKSRSSASCPLECPQNAGSPDGLRRFRFFTGRSVNGIVFNRQPDATRFFPAESAHASGRTGTFHSADRQSECSNTTKARQRIDLDQFRVILLGCVRTGNLPGRTAAMRSHFQKQNPNQAFQSTWRRLQNNGRAKTMDVH